VITEGHDAGLADLDLRATADDEIEVALVMLLAGVDAAAAGSVREAAR
jgi:hypothetical protein